MEKEPLYLEGKVRLLEAYDFIPKELINAAKNYAIETIEEIYFQVSGKTKEELEQTDDDLEIPRGTLVAFINEIEKMFIINRPERKLPPHGAGARYPGPEKPPSVRIKRSDLKYKPKWVIK